MQYIREILLAEKICEDSYLNNIGFVSYLQSGGVIKFEKDITFVVGENGSGKSTLLEAIAVNFGFNSEGGTKNFNFETVSAFYELADCIKVIKNFTPKDGFFFRAESFFNVASEIDRIASPAYGKMSLHKQSHGESFISLIENRFSENSLFILDEPEAALSPSRILFLMYRIRQLLEKNCQFIISTHSPILLAYPDAEIFEMRNDGMIKVEYKDSEVYKTYKSFLDNPERSIKYLFD